MKATVSARTLFSTPANSTTPADILPLVTENISWESLREGIDYCLERHIACRNEHALELPPGFRVIDIEKQCISTVQSQTCDFFALSYVWGKDDSPHSKITTENYAALSIPGALSRIQLPQTVQDAMTACAQLGRRDLWCDRLCIIQDDPEDKANQIAAMDRIYRSAQYVIVAYGSENMHSGMSGISRARPQTQMRVQLAGLVVTSDAFDDFCDHNFKGCAYLERGWTYQEYELARRKLCFRNTQAFLACRHGRKEEYHRGFGDNGDENQTARPLAPLFSQYTSHVEIYSGRRLSFYSDAIAAIAGVLQWLYEDKGEIVCGLPVIHFDKALLWYHEADNLNRPPNIGFPMWSWASSLGGCGKIKFQDALWRGIARLRAFEFCGTFVPWYALDAYGSVRPVNVVADYEPYERWKTYIAIAHEAGCVANMIHRQKGSVHWSDYNSYVRQVVPLELDTTGPPIPKLLSLETHIPRKHVLLTLTQTASLAWKLSSSDTHWGVQLLSHVGAKIGEVAVPLEDRSQYEQLPVQWTKDVEVIGISLAVMTAPGENAGLSASQCVDVDGQDFPDIPIVNVLVIERFGIFARRKYLGWVCFDDWARFERTWEYILLV